MIRTVTALDPNGCCDPVSLSRAQHPIPGLHDVRGLQAGGDDLADEAVDVLLIVGAVAVVDDAAALVGGNIGRAWA